MELSYTVLVLIIPVFMFLFLGIVGVKLSKKTAGLLGTLAMGVTTVIAYAAALTYFFGTGQDQVVDGVRQQLTVLDITWLEFTKNLVIKIGVLLDPISAMMLIVISTVSFMVHLYSLGYMDGEKGFQRYYAFLSLFTFSMLGLVLATNIFQMYIFWELVGVSSYLLIGFYYTLPAAVSASKKAFIVTRFADLGFLVGILILSFYTDTFDFITLTSDPQAAISTAGGATFLGCSVMTWALTLIFMGGAGKSAMFPLHIWLPDAMEGPTPVSALIHAATMVVAGVYLVARMFPVYAVDGVALDIITVVGAFTAFYAAAVACVQSDIKRVLAFSTISQIAFMITSLGVASPEFHHGVGYMASMFHLFTHAMFKALLFLCAGAIIHAVHSNEMSAMGGLRKYMPICHIAFLIGCLAIAGIPPFAGFFSKDEILVAAYGNSPLWGVWLSVVAGMTAFYMFRLYYKIFWWNNPDYGHHAPHEAPMTMTFPLIFLGLVSIVAGFIPFGSLVTLDRGNHPIEMDWTVAGTSVVIALVGIGLATVMYRKENDIPERLANQFRGLWTAAYHRFYMDELYQFITHKIIFARISKPIAWFDRRIIDGTMDLLANVTNSASFAVRRMQSGSVQTYVWFYLVGAVAVAVITIICLI
ncbi:MAG TPA: NADH-quinone oxidoreductase subunit L [Candidatus Avimuribaculum pullicola]|nr:NADH-quinone oxidoreductase subunit L [Candidatus Avimuribaculum pullicola]